MNIKVDCKLLSEQIDLCDAYSDYLKTEPLKEMFGGIAELLSAICFALEQGEDIYIEKVEEE